MTVHERRTYLDTEFIPSRRGPEGFISIGMVDDEGDTYYAVNRDMDQFAVVSNPWLRKNVWPHLPRSGNFLDWNHPAVKPLQQIRHDLVAWFAMRNPEKLYAWYGSQDLNRVHDMWDNDWTRMPEDIPRWFHEIQSLAHILGNPQLPEQDGDEHHALADAYHNRRLVWFLDDLVDTRAIHL